METAPLKSFATWARTALIREVTARISVVLAPASSERVEQPSAVAALERAVKAAGGGESGRVALADKVAYTWFNRIIALRFMDANGYTGIGVVSPERGRDGGQPEVLAEAKRGNIDSAVVINTRTVEAVTSLLNGARRSDDPQGEAYALLLAEYCRHWNRAMPFMFEREGDFSELLIPANLLAADSVLARAVAVLTEDVCQDVEVIGWLYQFYISDRKDEVFAGFKKNKKAGAAEIPAATQLFTPHWIVRYLVENSLGRLWLLNRPASRLADQMDYYIAPVGEETDFLRVTSPEELKIIDPACGSGHMLTYAFDLLYVIYEEEGYAPSDIPGLILANNLYGTEIDSRAGSLAAFALTMKARACQRTFFNKQIEPNICVLEPISFGSTELEFLLTRGGNRHEEAGFWNQFELADLLGSLIKPREERIEPLRRHFEANVAEESDLLAIEFVRRARRVITQSEFLSQRYGVVVANPPYMGASSMNVALAEFAARSYGASKSDLFAMFVERTALLTPRGGLVGMITMQSWMFLATYEKLRSSTLNTRRVVQLVQLGTGAFDTIGGAVVSTAAFIIQNAAGRGRAGTFIELTGFSNETAKRGGLLESVRMQATARKREVVPENFLRLPGAPFAHSIENFGVFDGPRLSKKWRSGGRLKTHDGARFIRYWWEVSKASPRWKTLVKGGDFQPYFGNRDFVVDWSEAAVANYRDHGGLYPEENRGSAGLCWTKITGRLSFRLKSEDEEFDSASPTLLPNDTHDIYATLAYLNSTEVRSLLGVLNPTINTQVSNVLELPAPGWDDSGKAALSELGSGLTEFTRLAWRAAETADGFEWSPLIGGNVSARLDELVARCLDESNARRAEALTLERLVDLRVAELLHTGIPMVADESSSAIGALELHTVRDLVTDLLSYSVGCMFGRYSPDEPGLILANQGETLQDYLAKIPNPTFAPDSDNVIPIVDGDWFEDDIVARFRQFLRVAFGEQNFEENLRFVSESLGGKDLRDYFVKLFYKDHVQRYKKRPIYWLFSSPKGAFNALIYMHRYTTSTASTVLNEYLREFRAKLDASRQHHERLAVGSGTPRQQATALKEVDRLRKVLLELDEYEHDVLYPLATQQVQIDLDDGVKANYSKFGAALKKIPGLEVSNE
jgi:hypothetical protein